MRNVNVVIEGPNGSGKTTLADNLGSFLKYDHINLRHQDGDQYLRYMSEYSRRRMVFCRGHWSEQVYSELFHRAQPFSPDEYASLTRIAQMTSVVVLCLPESPDLLKERFRQRVDQGFGSSMVEKYEELELEWELWNKALGTKAWRHDQAQVVYSSRNMKELHETAAHIKMLVAERMGA
jgi:thymidylate kinase